MKRCLDWFVESSVFFFLNLYRGTLERNVGGEFNEQVSRRLDLIQALTESGKSLYGAPRVE